MSTPICDFVKKYCLEGNHRLHMPGHKGKDSLGFESLDITEIDGADVLYHAKGIIAESEKNASELFGCARTVYSAEGSSLSIRAMVYLAALYAECLGKKAHILAGRNAHKAFVMAAALSDVTVSWLYGKDSEGLVSCRIDAETLERALSDMPESPVAVYITSPDYLGNIADISALSRVCKRHGTLLFVDNAHGAYLRFLTESRHPIDLGADICCDSAHKTLPVITGGGYLHISQNAPRFFVENADRAMTVFASTSPSYLILQSLDHANEYLANDYRARLSAFCDKIDGIKKRLSDGGVTLCGDERLKITVLAKPLGYRGDTLAEHLAKRHRIHAEFSDPDYIVFMVTPETDDGALEAFETALLSLPRLPMITSTPPSLPRLPVMMTPREALYCPSERVPLEDSVGRILASPTVSCPPAVPIAVCGEMITEQAVEMMRYYGVEWVECTCGAMQNAKCKMQN